MRLIYSDNFFRLSTESKNLWLFPDHLIRQPTRDDDFYDCNLCHAGYCLVYLAVRKNEVAIFMRWILHYKEFDTGAKRMGSVIRDKDLK